ncbi:MAG: pyruvate formate lyase-activating protein [Gracilibacteraceae bacterium]|nr:pyruvate formate lyase-activating protein [Gracilibacteraceae bacterium]
MPGRVSSLQSLGAADGPGVRFVIFLQGCPLRCPYCHNPETWAENGGQTMEAGECLEKIRRARPYLSGGVTLSGGEPLLQAGFALELFQKLKAECFHTALDTSGCLEPPELGALLDVTDLVLLDIKRVNARDCRREFGLSLELPLRLLRRLEERNKPVWIRQVIVPGINDKEDELKDLRKLAGSFSCVKRLELLPFRKLCAPKYAALGLPFPYGDKEELREDRHRELQENYGFIM